MRGGRHALRVGRIGEYLTAAELEALSVKCDIVSQVGFDILAWHDNGPIRVQVKSTLRPGMVCKSRKTPTYNFCCSYSGKNAMLTDKQTDIIALCAIDIKRIRFIHVSEVSGKNHRLRVDMFDEELLEKETWGQSVKKFTESQTMHNDGFTRRANNKRGVLPREFKARRSNDDEDWQEGE